MKRFHVLLLSLPFLVIGCNKGAGPGGTSSIKGTVTGIDHENGDAEVTEIVFTEGLEVEHGDYFLLNTPANGNYYYIWYDNPGWVSNGDPGLAGRTGISVTFNYSDSNVDIATNTLAALGNYTGTDYWLEQFNDVLRITCRNSGYCPDADEVTTPFEFNIVDQGEDATVNPEAALVDERVYLIYGTSESFNDDTRTGIDGDFQFNNLRKGDYRVYLVAKDTLTGDAVKQEISVTIDKNKSVVDLGEIFVVH